MSSKNGLKYKKRAFFARIFAYFFSSSNRYILSLFGMLILLIIAGFANTFRAITLLFVILVILFGLRLKNFFVSSFLVSIFVAPFFNPNKYYSIVVIKGLNRLIDFKGDYLLGYGVNLVNIFLFLALVALGREIILKKVDLGIFARKSIAHVTVFALGFFLVGLGSSLTYSPFPQASVVWLFGYMQLFLTAFLVFYLYVVHRKNFDYLYSTIAACLSLQVFISFWQFLKQGSVGLPIEFIYSKSYFASGLDEVNILFRVSGTFNYHNQLALIISSWIVILVTYALKRRNKFMLIIVILGLVTVILTMSRSIWIADFLVFIVFISFYKKDLIKIFKSPDRKFVIYTLLIAASSLYVVFPRVLLSFNAFYQGAGFPLRVSMIEESLYALRHSFLIGYGVGTNEYILNSFFPYGVMSVFPSAVHMAFLQLALEVGILGLLFFVSSFFYIFWKLRRGVSKNETAEERNFRFIFYSGILVFFLYYLFQPHVGIIEFSYLGIITGFGIISLESRV